MRQFKDETYFWISFYYWTSGVRHSKLSEIDSDAAEHSLSFELSIYGPSSYSAKVPQILNECSMRYQHSIDSCSLLKRLHARLLHFYHYANEKYRKKMLEEILIGKQQFFHKAIHATIVHIGNETFYGAIGIACDWIWWLSISQERIQLENVYEIEDRE